MPDKKQNIFCMEIIMTADSWHPAMNALSLKSPELD